MLHLAAKAFWPAPVPFPVLHVDTGHNFPEVLAFRDETVERLGAAARGRPRAGLHRRRPAAGARRRHPQPAADRAAARRDRRRPPRRGLRRRPPRRGEGPRQGAHLSACATSSASGTRATSAPSCGTSTTAATRPASTCASSRISNWTELDVWRYIEREEIALPPLYYAHEREVYRARRHVARRSAEVSPAARRRDGRAPARCATAPSATCRCTGAVESDAARPSPTIITEVGRVHAHRARRDPRRRPALRGRHGGPQEGGVLLMTAFPARRDRARSAVDAAPVRDRRLGRRRQVDPGRPAAARLQGGPRRPARAGRARRPSAASRTARSTSRCSPTACAPSASRASRSTSPTATSPRRRGSSSSPTAPATCSTPATRSPAPPPPTPSCCWSTPARACSSRPAATWPSSRCCACRTSSSRSTRSTCVGYAEDVFARRRRRRSRAVARELGVARRRTSSRSRRSRATTSSTARPHTPWYDGPRLLELLETLPAADELEPELEAFRLPVQLVHPPAGRPRARRRRPSDAERYRDYRAVAGRIASGTVRVGDEVQVFPSGIAHDRHRHRVAGAEARRGRRPAVGLAPARRRRRRRARRRRSSPPARCPRRAASSTPSCSSSTPGRSPRRARARQARHAHRAGDRRRRSIDRRDLDTLAHEPADTPRDRTTSAACACACPPTCPIEPYGAHRRGGSFLVIHPSDGATLAAGITRG